MRAALLLALGLACAAPALAQGGPPMGSSSARIAYGNPSAGIAADIAFARLAAQKGRWAAFRETAADDAVMFAPHMVLAQTWLKGRAETTEPLTWQPHAAWSSCDGSTVLTSGAWQSGANRGWYVTIWQRQKDGGYKWVYDDGVASGEDLTAPDMLTARVAECPPRPPRPAGEPPRKGKKPKPPKAPPIPFDPASRQGGSADGSLTWNVTVEPSGAHRFTARMRTGGEMQVFQDRQVAAPGS